MWRLTLNDFNFIAACLEGFLYGIYSGIFMIYLQLQVARAKKETNKSQNIIFYSICILYALSIAMFASDTAQGILDIGYGHLRSPDQVIHLYIVQNTLFGCCDFIAQFVLIYRCWIVWRRNIRVIIIPSILTIAFLIVWIVAGSTQKVVSLETVIPYWGDVLTLLGLTLSLTVNALVTGLIIFRIFKVFREVRSTSEDQILGATGGSKLRDIIFILIESGMALFAIQLVRLVVGNVAFGPQDIMISIQNMFTGITPTFILVRTTMGLSFDEDRSIEDVAIGSLHFASNPANSVPEMGSTNILDEDRRDDDGDTGIRQENDIEVVDR